MDCRKFSKGLNDYLVGELSEEECEAMSKHMDCCDSCRALFEEEYQSSKEFLGLEQVKAKSLVSSRIEILNSIDKDRYGLSPIKRMGFFFKKNFPGIAAGAVTTAVVVLISIYSIGYFRSMNSKPSIVETPNRIDTQPGNSDKNSNPIVTTPIDNSQKDNINEKAPILYTNEKLGFSFSFLGSWEGKYTISEDENGIRVYFKPQDKTLKTSSLLFCILKKSYPYAENTDTVGEPRSFTAKGVEYIVGGPTDVGFPPEHKEFNDYKKMHEEIKSILTTFKILNSTSNTQGVFKVEQLYGDWRITKLAGYGPVGTYSNEDIKTIIGRKMSFSKDKATCFGDSIDYLNQTVSHPIYETSTIKKDDFFSDYKVSFESLGLTGNSVTQVVVKDSKQDACIIFIKDRTTILVYGGGNFFELDISLSN